MNDRQIKDRISSFTTAGDVEEFKPTIEEWDAALQVKTEEALKKLEEETIDSLYDENDNFKEDEEERVTAEYDRAVARLQENTERRIDSVWNAYDRAVNNLPVGE